MYAIAILLLERFNYTSLRCTTANNIFFNGESNKKTSKTFWTFSLHYIKKVKFKINKFFRNYFFLKIAICKCLITINKYFNFNNFISLICVNIVSNKKKLCHQKISSLIHFIYYFAEKKSKFVSFAIKKKHDIKIQWII